MWLALLAVISDVRSYGPRASMLQRRMAATPSSMPQQVEIDCQIFDSTMVCNDDVGRIHSAAIRTCSG